MNTFKSALGKFGLVLGLLFCGAFIAASGLLPGFPPRASAETEDWQLHSEHMICGALNGTQASPALIDTAVTGYRIGIKSMTVAAGTAGTYHFFSGSTPTGANEVATFYFAANTPYTINVTMFRGAVRTANGSGLYEVGAGTLTYTMVNRLDPGT